MSLFGKIINVALNKFNLKIISKNIDPSIDIRNDQEFQELYSFCAPFTMTSMERMYSLYNSLKYITDNNIEGDFVECGVWRGGSSMLIARYLQLKKINSRKIYLYDTFEGMPKPGDKDISYSGDDAMNQYLETATGDDSSSWCQASIEDVKQNMFSTGYDRNNIVFIKGKVEETMPDTLPEKQIAFLRLDTDWYDSTKHELKYLFPLLVKNGVLIIDDFGHWEGAKKAVLEYFKETNQTILLNRIDYTGRVGIKTN